MTYMNKMIKTLTDNGFTYRIGSGKLPRGSFDILKELNSYRYAGPLPTKYNYIDIYKKNEKDDSYECGQIFFSVSEDKITYYNKYYNVPKALEHYLENFLKMNNLM